MGSEGGLSESLGSPIAASLATASPYAAEPHPYAAEPSAAVVRAERIAEVCSFFQSALGLQADSVRNQREHVEALWESFAARHDSSEAALRDLASQLLRTSNNWLLHVWQPLFGAPETLAQDHLSDVCLYLLLWGELGQLRFCPELLAFLFAAARAHCAAPFRPVVQPEGAFLENVAKPIFNVFLRETFEPGDPPRFRSGSAPAPASACNYDDWNELFWDARRLQKALRLKSSTRRKPVLLRWGLPAEDVWTLLPGVDWAASFHGAKSHRELHSMLALLVGCYRVFLLCFTPFAGLVLYWTEKPSGVTWSHFAPLGLIAPAFLSLHELGLQVLTPAMAWRQRFAGVLQLACVGLLPSFSFALLLWLRGRPPLYERKPEPEAVVLACFTIHYVNRALVYPLRMKGSKPIPLPVMLMAMSFCMVNGYIQCVSLMRLLLIRTSAITLPLGVSIWALGLYINWDSDQILRNLRKPGETGYKIPRGGMFEYVSGANLFGEALEWAGFAVAMGGALPGVTFAFCTACNVGPRAIEHHRWYLQKFKDTYPKQRRAFIPFLL